MATVRLQLRRGTSSQWTGANPILAAGEMGVETDTRKVKIGDGSTSWTSLNYIAADNPEISEIAQDAIDAALVAGTGIVKSYNDGTNTITVSVDTSVIATKAELAEVSQDSVNDALVAGVGLNKTYDDVNNLITIDIDSTVATLTDAQTLTNKTLTSPVINTPTGIVKADVGLGNVDNTSDANKPISTATQTALNLKANLASPALTGTPTAPTASAGTNNTQIATTAYVETAVSNLVSSAPETLNTLNELSEALADDPNFSTTITTSIGTKVAKSGDTMTGPLVLNADPASALHAATKQYVDTVANAKGVELLQSIEDHRADTTNVHGIADTSLLVTESTLNAHNSATTNVHGIADTSLLATKSYADNSANQAANQAKTDAISAAAADATSKANAVDTSLGYHTAATTGVHGIADTSVLVTNSTLNAHTSDTTGVHGISDTANLVYATDLANQIDIAKSYADSSVIAHNSDTTGVHGIADTSVLVTNSTLNSHTSATTNVHGISNTADLVTLSGTQTLVNKTLTAPSITSPTGIVKSDVGLGNVDNTSDANKPVSTAQASANTAVANAAAEALAAHESDTTNVHGIADTALLATKSYADQAEADAISAAAADATSKANAALNSANTYTDGKVSALIDSAPGALDTLNELAAAIGDDANYASTITNALALKAPLASPTFTGTVTLPTGTVTSEMIADGTIVDADVNASAAIAQSKIANLTTDLADKAPLASPTFTGTVSGITKSMVGLSNVDNTSDVNKPISTATQAALDAKAPLASPNFTGTVSGITKSMVGLGNVDNTTDLNKPISTATQTALDLKANLASPTFTGTVTLPSTTSVGNVSSTELGYLDGVTSAVQTQLDAKAPLASPTFTGTVTLPTGTVTSGMIADGTIVNADINASAAIALSKLASGTSGQIIVANSSGVPTWVSETGDVTISDTGVTAISSGVIVDADVNASAAIAQSKIANLTTDLAAKLALSGGTMTGALTLSGAPSSDLHAATKAYVDNVSSGINFHQPVRVATTANITLSGTQTIDGVSVVAGDRVLVKDQTNQTQNGIYVVATGSWTRAEDADNTPNGELAGGDFTLVLEGNVNSGYGYVCSNTSAITIGTTNVTYAPFNAAKAVTAGSGLTESTPGTIDIATGGVTSAMIADGTIVDADVNASAAIAQSKIANLTTDLAAKAPLASPTFTGTVSGITKSMVGLSNVDNTSDANKQVSIATQTALDLKANLASPTFTGTVTLPSTTSVGNVSSTEIGYLDGVTSAVQTQLDAKAPLASPTFTGTVTLPTGTVTSGMIADGTIVNADINASAAIALSKLASGTSGQIIVANSSGVPTWVSETGDVTISDTGVTAISSGVIVDADVNASAAIAQSKIANLTTDLAAKAPLASPTFTGTVTLPSTTSVGNVSSTEIGYLDGVTSAVQTQLDAKAPLASPTFTGTVSGITKSMVGLGNVDNTSDANKPVSTATQAALDAKAPLASPALTGTPTAPTATAGTNTTQVATTAFVKTAVDNLVSSAPAALDTLNELSAALGNDANFSTTVTNSLAAKAPLASPTFTGTVTLPTGTVTSAMIADGTIVDADVNASAAIAQSKIANLTTDLAAKAPLASPTFTGTVTVAASGVAFTDGTQTKAGVPSLTTIGATINATYNLSSGGLSLRDQLIPVSGGQAITVPANSTTAYPVGTSISFYQSSGTGANFVEASGVTILRTPGLKLRTTSSSATLTKVATDTWLLAGDLSA